MRINLGFASLITLGLLSGFVFAIIAAIMYFAGNISWAWMLAITIIFNLVMWLVGPTLSDFMYRWFYRATLYKEEDLKGKKFATFIRKVCDKHKIPYPTIGIIPDNNPTAFTYGSGPWNSRIVLSEGLFHYLNEDELEAVIAHELGHIVHKDFIVMAVASLLLQILYQLYVIFARGSMSRGSALGKRGSKDDDGSSLIIIGYVSLLFYYIGMYVLLFLSRLREYYADEFSAQETGDPNLLSSALIKIAYGIAVVPDTQKTAHLLNSTRALGVFDFKAAESVGLVVEADHHHKGAMEKAFLFDMVNPWAKLLELKSTHPLTGKRISALCSMTSKPLFNINQIKKKDVDYGRLWQGFFVDLAVVCLPTLIFLTTLIALIYGSITELIPFKPVLFGGFALFVLAAWLKVSYRYPKTSFKKTTVAALMSDLYASPIKGQPVELEGKAVGKGQAGNIVSEDMMFQDSTGLLYLNYEGAVPFFGNLLFGISKVKHLVGKRAQARGWFVRGVSQHMELAQFEADGELIKSYVRFWGVFGYIFSVLLLGAVVFFLYLIY